MVSCGGEIVATFLPGKAAKGVGDGLPKVGDGSRFGGAQCSLTDGEICTPQRGWPRKPPPLRPVAPFSRNIGEATETAFDRETGETVEPGLLMTYAEALAQYQRFAS
jgi:hypothetical protein